MIEWNKHHTREDTKVSLRRVWKSKCGLYRVEYSECQYGNSRDRHGNSQGYPPFYRIVHHARTGWTILGEDFRKRTTAMQAAEHHAEHGYLPIKKKRRKKVPHADAQ